MHRETEIVPKTGERKPTPEETAGAGDGGDRIKCPHCKWAPASHHLWMCSCRRMWHTFDTGGICPKCLLQWMHTQCPTCHLWSAHSEWYPKD